MTSQRGRFVAAAWHEIETEADLLASLGGFPLWTKDGKWLLGDLTDADRGVLPHDASWMVGDLPAMLWLLVNHSAASVEEAAHWRGLARTWSARLHNRTNLTTFASVSHLFLRGGLLGFELCHEGSLKAMVAAAAVTVLGRFRAIGYMKSFGPPGDLERPFTTIDDVINYSLPLWYALGRHDDADVTAMCEAIDVIGDRLVRDDGSVAQVLRFTADGRPDVIDTYQGLSPASCWSRGQAWGIYGFATVYGQTRNEHYLDLANRLADYWMTHVISDPSPVWDFSAPNDSDTAHDSFAASLGYAGLLKLAESCSEPRREQICDYVETMLAQLADAHVYRRARGLGLVGGAALDVPHGHGIDCCVIVGDSYFTEAVWRLTRIRSLSEGRGETDAMA